MGEKRIDWLLRCLSMIVVLIVLFVLYAYNIIPHRIYFAQDFHIERIYSHHDENKNGIDDLDDILAGAKLEIAHMPTYRSAYYEGGYPPQDEGVCSDVIWRSLRHAGYNFKDMIDADIQACRSCYQGVKGEPDPNIDFRRVMNIDVYLKRHAQRLTLDLQSIEEWQPGDIVVFSNTHIGILSDKRNKHGIPFLLHNGNLPVGEEDCLLREDFLKGIKGHYRFIMKEDTEL